MEQEENLLTKRSARTSNLLDFVRSLHSTLEPNTILQLFSKELNKHLPFDSLSYINTAINAHYTQGQKETHSFSYHLSTADTDLGELIFTRRNPFNDEEIFHLEELLCLLIPSLKNAITHFHALQTALHDPLTQLLNRGSLDKTLRRELKLASRHKQPFCCLMFDIDNFKKINDKYGHPVGDHVLVETSNVIKETVRDTDMAFRIGGEEFLVLLNNTDHDGAYLLAERLRDKIEKNRINIANHEFNYTVSVGVAHYTEEEDGQALIAKADQALYQAKNSGKNCICVDD